MGPVIPLHLGALHPVEQIATIVLAFGPFLVLGIVIAVRRRAESDEDLEDLDDLGAAEEHDQNG